MVSQVLRRGGFMVIFFLPEEQSYIYDMYNLEVRKRYQKEQLQKSLHQGILFYCYYVIIDCQPSFISIRVYLFIRFELEEFIQLYVQSIPLNYQCLALIGASDAVLFQNKSGIYRNILTLLQFYSSCSFMETTFSGLSEMFFH